jgi:Fur family transcriptional regulator, ferric uptake regulator
VGIVAAVSARARKNWVAHTLRTLERAGYRSSGPRVAVVEALGRQGCSVTAREVADLVGERRTGVGLASVYRALELLDRMKLVQRFEVGEGMARYEPAYPSGEHHHHLVCERCGAVTAFEDDELEHAIEQVAGRVDFSIDGHDVTLRGQCPDCRGARPRAGRRPRRR